MNYLFILSENVIPVLIGSTYFYFGGKNWANPFIISLVLPVLGFILIQFIPRSPVFLLEKGQIKETEEVLRTIASYNERQLPYEFDIVRISKSNHNDEGLIAKKRKLFTHYEYLTRLGLLIFLTMHSNANQVMWGFYLKNLSINIFLVNIIDSFSSTFFII